MRRLCAVALALMLLGGTAPVAGATDRWTLADVRSVPLNYFQGLTHAPDGRRYFAGIFEGLYATDLELHERRRNPQAIPQSVTVNLGFNHIGDLTYDPTEGGRLLLPLECYSPLAANGGNTCGRGAIAVADPATLAWRYVVPLSPVDLRKAMWAEVAPDGALVWTSSGADLLAYRTADISPAAAAAGAPIRPAVRLAGAVPPSGITGAAFVDGRLLVAGQAAGPLQLWSVDLSGATPPQLEASLNVSAESEGLDAVRSSAGVLHWLLSPVAPGSAKPTYGDYAHSTVLAFVPRGQDRLQAAAIPTVVRAGHRTKVGVRVTLAVDGISRPVRGATVRQGTTTARTDGAGRAALMLRPRRAGTLPITVTKQRLVRTTLRVVVRRSS